MHVLAIASCLLGQASGLNASISAAGKKLDTMRSFSVRVDVATTSGQNAYRSKYDIRFLKPNTLLMRIQEPQQGGKAATDRSYYFNGPRLIAVDSIAREQLSRGVSTKEPMYLRVSSVLGRLGEAFEMAISGERARFILTALADGQKWSRKGDQWEASNAEGLISIKFESGLVRSIVMVSKDRSSRWSFDYLPLTTVPKLAAPASYRRVPSFLEHPSEPKFASSPGRKLYQKAVSAYQSMRHVDLVSTGDRGEKVQIKYSGKFAREDWMAYSWSYDGTRLTIVDYYRKVTYHGPARGSQVIEMLANAGCPMHPFTRSAFRKQNWLRTVLAEDMTVDRAGVVTLNGLQHEVLSFRAESFKGTMLIDGRSGRVSEVNIKHLSRYGAVVNTSQSTYRFKSVGKPLAPTLFKLAGPKGFVAKPVGPLADKTGS